MPEQNYDSSTITVGAIAWDSHWLTLLKEMHEPTWDDLVTNYAADLRHDISASLRKRGLSPDLVEDVEQETWRIAVQKIGAFNADTIDKLYHWLRVIALNRRRTATSIWTRFQKTSLKAAARSIISSSSMIWETTARRALC